MNEIELGPIWILQHPYNDGFPRYNNRGWTIDQVREDWFILTRDDANPQDFSTFDDAADAAERMEAQS